MRSNEYYSKTRVTIVIVFAIVFNIVFTMISTMTASEAADLNITEFTPNFDKKFKQVVVLSNTKSIDKEEKDEYSLRNVKYDISTLYLDYSEIEAERSKIEQAAKEKAAKEKELMEATKGQLNFSNNTVSSLMMVEGSLELPNISDTSFKGYMNVNKVTSRTSNQWKFLHSGNFDLYTDNNGIMMYNGYYIVAMGSYYTNYKVGSTFRITLDSGISFDVITGDEKADQDTDSNRTYRPKGNNRGEIVEFLVYHEDDPNPGYQDTSKYKSITSENRELGDLSSLGFQGNVAKIEKLNDYSVVDLLYRE